MIVTSFVLHWQIKGITDTDMTLLKSDNIPAILCEGLLKEARGTPFLREEMFGDPSQNLVGFCCLPLH